jgi:sulfonate transport system ATP-binding protein
MEGFGGISVRVLCILLLLLCACEGFQGGPDPLKGQMLPGVFNFDVAKGESRRIFKRMDSEPRVTPVGADPPVDWSDSPQWFGSPPVLKFLDVKKVISPNRLQAVFGGKDMETLRGINAELHLANGTALVGLPDSGKSTLLKIIAGIDMPTSGGFELSPSIPVVYIDRDRYPWGLHESKREGSVRAGVEDIVRERISSRGENAVQLVTDRILWISELSHKASEIGKYLSGSEIKRMGIAFALAESSHSLRPPLLLFDEYMEKEHMAVRRREEQTIRRLHQFYGVSYIITTHEPYSAKVMGEVVMTLSNGGLEQISDNETNAFINIRIEEKMLKNSVGLQASEAVDQRLHDLMHPLEALTGERPPSKAAP